MSRHEAPDAPKSDTPIPALEKEVVRLPDGRELTYYRFPDPPTAAPASRKER